MESDLRQLIAARLSEAEQNTAQAIDQVKEASKVSTDLVESKLDDLQCQLRQICLVASETSDKQALVEYSLQSKLSAVQEQLLKPAQQQESWQTKEMEQHRQETEASLHSICAMVEDMAAMTRKKETQY